MDDAIHTTLMVAGSRLSDLELTTDLPESIYNLLRAAACPIDTALALLGDGTYGELDPPEGVVYRVEATHPRTKRIRLEILAKYVRPEFVPGRYLPELSGGEAVWNWRPAARGGVYDHAA